MAKNKLKNDKTNTKPNMQKLTIKIFNLSSEKLQNGLVLLLINHQEIQNKKKKL